MQTIRYKFLELVLIFIVIPISFTFNYTPILKLITGVLGFTYILYVLLRVKKIKLHIDKNINWKKFWKDTFLKFLVFIVVTSIFFYVTD